MKCKYNDCGYCYAPEGLMTNCNAGSCIEPSNCPEYLSQQDEYNIAASMEPVSVFDATSHSNSEWAEEYATWDDVPEDLKWLAENADRHVWTERYLSGEKRGQQPFLSADESDFLFSRAQWQRARELYLQQQPASEWDGKGLPTVGAVCKARPEGHGDHILAKCLLHDGSYSAFVKMREDGSGYNDQMLFWSTDFRPILTEAQKAEQERDEAFYQFCRITGADKADPAMQDLFSDLYDAGYRLKDTNND